MGKKMCEKDGHKWENKQIEEGNFAEKEIDVFDVSTENMNGVPKSSDRVDDKNEKEDRSKKRKAELDTNIKEYQEAHKKHKKSKNVVEVKEISKETCFGGKENTEHEGSDSINLENNGETKRAMKGKHKKKNDGIDAVATVVETLEHSKLQEPVEVQKICSPEDTNKMVHREEETYKKRKKKKKQKSEKVNGDVADDVAVVRSNKMVHGEEEAYKKQKKKKKKKKKKKQKLEKVNGNVADNIAVTSSIADENVTSEENTAVNETECRKLQNIGGDTEDGNGRKKRKSKSVKIDSEDVHREGDARNISVDHTNQVDNATPKDKSKKVSFCDQVEVFPYMSATDNSNKDGKEGLVKDSKEGLVKDSKEGLVYGKRYSKEEDELVMNAVAEYIESHNLGDEGLNMVLNCGVHPEVRNCWKEIQAAIPWRPVNSVYHRAHILFERDEKHPWTPEELEMVQKFVEKHGRKWKLLADSLGKHRHHVKDTWRRIKLTNANKGRWSQEEYQNLFDLVNLDLSMKANHERLSKHGMLRDNICWTAISDKMETRPFVSCCIQWYRKLTSPMVAEGIWADADDYRMLDALSSLDACCMEDVDWDNLLENRSGDLCRKRWGQMVQHLGPNKDMSFAEQVDVLANRYRPDMVEARETYDSKRPSDLP